MEPQIVTNEPSMKEEQEQKINITHAPHRLLYIALIVLIVLIAVGGVVYLKKISTSPKEVELEKTIPQKKDLMGQVPVAFPEGLMNVETDTQAFTSYEITNENSIESVLEYIPRKNYIEAYNLYKTFLIEHGYIFTSGEQKKDSIEGIYQKQGALPLTISSTYLRTTALHHVTISIIQPR